MHENVSWNGISIEGIDKLMSDILDYVDKSNKILNQIDDLVDETSSYFSCESGDKFREKFEMLKAGTPIINSNILSYNTDLMNVKHNYQLRANAGVDMLNAGNNQVGSDI